jgi:hypothetical protein
MAEAAIGLVLGILPLLISTAEHFDDIAQPFRRYRHFHDGVKKFHGSLQTQKTIFRNFCELLLKSVVNNDVAVRVLDRGIDASEELDLQLSVALGGNSAEACMRIVEEVEAILCMIAEEKFLEVGIEEEEEKEEKKKKRQTENLTAAVDYIEATPARLGLPPLGSCRPSHHRSSHDNGDYIKDERSPHRNHHHGRGHISSSDKQSLDRNHHHMLMSRHSSVSESATESEKVVARVAIDFFG